MFMGSPVSTFHCLPPQIVLRADRTPDSLYLEFKILSMSTDFKHHTFRMPNIGFQNLPLNIYIVVFGTAIFVFILSLLFCCYLIRFLSHCSERLRLLVMEITAPGPQRVVRIQTGYTERKGQRAKFA
ncbi:RING finger protein 24 isoform X3 [Gadus macrocephalus]|uniref:RING finger protein 24 isoform X3 n=1 Tax=Gadus macrocephalus TaxID=80720 RepID=UPI0028CB50CF|nr:RING finger protein 24 isoform X3 [Gadus macrocephalus]